MKWSIDEAQVLMAVKEFESDGIPASVESIAVADNRVSGVRIINEQGRKEIMASDAYVACLASYTPRLLAPIGISVPVYPAPIITTRNEVPM